jgi:hypothetical protein
MEPQRKKTADYVVYKVNKRTVDYFLISRTELEEIRANSIISNVSLFISSLLLGAYLSVLISISSIHYFSISNEVVIKLHLFGNFFLVFGVFFFIITLIFWLIGRNKIKNLFKQNESNGSGF